MATGMLSNKLVGINEMNELKRIINRKIIVTDFYKNSLHMNTAIAVYDLHKIAALSRLPLDSHNDETMVVSYRENARLLETFLPHWQESQHARDQIINTSAQLLAEGIFIFKNFEKPPYFDNYKQLVIEALSSDFETNRILKELFNI